MIIGTEGPSGLAFQGDSKIIHTPKDGLAYFNKLSDTQKRKALMLFKRMGDFRKISDITKFINEGDKVFAFKPQPDRFLSFFWTGKKVVVTNGFRKQSRS